MSILVATDFSPCSRAAVRLATALAQRRNVPLFLVHAFEPPSIDLFTVPTGSGGWQTELLNAAEAAVARDASDIRQAGVAVEGRVLVGSAASAVLEAALEHAVELIVVGTHGRKGSARLFLGSVAENVVRSSNCPVLVTGDGVSNLARWEGRAPLRMTVATDGSTASHAALSWVGALAKAQPCDLSLVRVYWPSEEAIRFGLDDAWGGPQRDQELLPLIERALRHDAETLIGELPTRLRYRAAGPHAGEALAAEVTTLETDALVIGVPRHRILSSTVLAPGPVLRSSTVPVLCVPESMAPANERIAQIRSVLIATDLSDVSRAAISPAYGLLGSGGGRAELCYVHELGPVNALAEMPVALPLRDQQRNQIEAQLRELIPPQAETLGIATGISVVEGRSAGEAILAAAERLGVDVVALASHGRSGIKRALLGSVAEEVARQSPRPVLLVRAPSAGKRS